MPHNYSFKWINKMDRRTLTWFKFRDYNNTAFDQCCQIDTLRWSTIIRMVSWEKKICRCNLILWVVCYANNYEASPPSLRYRKPMPKPSPTKSNPKWKEKISLEYQKPQNLISTDDLKVFHFAFSFSQYLRLVSSLVTLLVSTVFLHVQEFFHRFPHFRIQ